LETPEEISETKPRSKTGPLRKEVGLKQLFASCLIVIALIFSEATVKAQERSQAIPPPAEASFPRLERVPTPQAFGSARGHYREPRVVKKGILAPLESDVAQHQFLLSKNNTGLMRLLPREQFDWEVYKVRKQAGMRGGGAYFSFHYRSHEYGYGSDISYERGILQVGFAGADYGMLADLGDTPLESISTEDPRAGYLLNYKAARKEKDARLEFQKFNTIRGPQGLSGYIVDGVSYQRRVEAVENHTYLLRSIVYGTSDLLVAFRVVRINDDGGLTIAWKILKKFHSTELIRN
jgi:hypothetical protein